MKSFIIKVINLLLISGVIAGYQYMALDRQDKSEQYKQEQMKAQAAWREVGVDSGSNADNKKYKDGTYSGTGQGFGGDIVVEVSIKKKEIVSLKIISAKSETPEYLESAEKILDFVVNEQTDQVDTVSGATLSSNGILEAVHEALQKATV